MAEHGADKILHPDSGSTTRSWPRPFFPARTWTTYKSRYALVLHVDGGDNVYAGAVTDCGRNELEAGRGNDSARQLDCPYADDVECARRGEVRHSVSYICSGEFWHAWDKHPGDFVSDSACGWFGIESWIGGQSSAAIVNVIWPSTVANRNIL